MATREGTIADAIVTSLNAASLSISFTATRQNVADVELKDMSGIVVSVVPRSKTTERINRIQWREEHEILIYLQKKLDQTSDETQLDTLRTFAEEVEDHLKTATSRMGGAALVELNRESIFDAEAIVERQQFEARIAGMYHINHS